MKNMLKLCTTIILSISIIVTIFAAPFSLTALSSSDVVASASQSKIAPDLYETADIKDGKYCVSLFLESIPDDIINKAVLQKTGYSVDVYESDAFYTEVASRIQKQIEESSQTAEVDVSSVGVSTMDATAKLDAALQSEMDQYIVAKRGVIKELNTAKNTQFISKHSIDSKNIVYQSRYASFITLYLTKQQINTISLDESVVQILPSINTPEQAAYDRVMPQTHVDDTSGTKSASFNSGHGFWGDGIKIGVIEAGSGICDVNYVQLSDAYTNGRLFILSNSYIYEGQVRTVTPTVTNHATVVTSLMIGAPITTNNRTYCGVVPNATVYQIPVQISADVVHAVEVLADQGVSIINYSGGAMTDQWYDEYDLKIDLLVKNLGITFVSAAGNSGATATPYISSPGKAYNVITVGNAETKSNNGVAVNSPFGIYNESSYEEASYLTNKPDIVAPGSYFTFPNFSFNPLPCGTSFSAPIVAGVAAQIHQANLTCKTNYTLTKAILLAGADYDAISATNNATCIPSGYAREKSGAGFVNATNSVAIALNSTYGYSNVNLKQSAAVLSYVRRFTVTIPANSKLRVALTYNKPENISLSSRYGNDVDLYLCDSTKEIVDFSSSYDNVEILEYSVAQSGTYYIEIHFYTVIPSDVLLYLSVGVAWQIEPVS